MQADAGVAMAETKPFSAFETYLNGSNEVVQCAALRALTSLQDDDPGAIRSACLTALQNPDPDVRSDAMTVLGAVARPEDAVVVRHSLELDPVREVKLAAIAILAGTNDAGSVDLLRALALSRCEERIAWEDQDSDWEDWLDIQIAAIRALGTMCATNAVEDFLAARDDEFGQSLDVTVFAALGDMGAEGVATLIRILDAETGLAQRRAASALSDISPDALRPYLDTLLTLPEVPLRRLALELLDIDDPRGPAIAEVDPDPTVRIAAMRRFHVAAPDLAITALSDADETVRAAAINLIAPPLDATFQANLLDNMLAWLPMAGPSLGTAIATKLAQLDHPKAVPTLGQVVENNELPLEVRVASVRALGLVKPSCPMQIFGDLLGSPAQQVRAATLTVLRDRASRGDDPAIALLAQAIEGTLLTSQTAVSRHPNPENIHDFATPKEDAGPNRIIITHEGDIVTAHEAADVEGQSTLDAILAGATPNEQPAAEDTPEESQAKRRKRRAVEGPDEVGLSLAVDALRIAGNLDKDQITTAIVSHLTDPDDALRREAWRAISLCGASDAVHEVAAVAMRDEDPVIRLAVFGILLRRPDAKIVAAALADKDALIRAKALAHLPADKVIDYVADPSLTVRQAAAKTTIKSADMMGPAIERLINSDYFDVLSLILASSAKARSVGHQLLGQPNISAQSAFILLNGFAGIRAE